MKAKIISILMITVLALGLSGTGTKNSSAQDAALRGEAVGTLTGTCPSEIRSELIKLQTDYFVLLEEVLESPELTSEQLNGIYQDYLDYKQNLLEVASTPVLQTDDIFDTARIRQDCNDIYYYIVNQTQDVFTEYVSQVTSRKRNFVLNEKYDHITAGLTEMQELLQDIQSNFTTFEAQLPCIIEQCIQR